MRSFAALGVAASLLVATACAPTTYDATRAVSTAPATTTTLPTGTTTELLERLVDEALTLSSVMIADGDSRAVSDRIAALWAATRAEVLAIRPDLVEQFDVNVQRCATAVQYRRAADADKAARNLDALVSAFVG